MTTAMRGHAALDSQKRAGQRGSWRHALWVTWCAYVRWRQATNTHAVRAYGNISSFMRLVPYLLWEAAGGGARSMQI